MTNFPPLEFVGRASETQTQVDENLNTLTRVRGNIFVAGQGGGVRGGRSLKRSGCSVITEIYI